MSVHFVEHVARSRQSGSGKLRSDQAVPVGAAHLGSGAAIAARVALQPFGGNLTLAARSVTDGFALNRSLISQHAFLWGPTSTNRRQGLKLAIAAHG
jgi:hypothetical protein